MFEIEILTCNTNTSVTKKNKPDSILNLFL